ncbi:MAG: LacI family DNA-binding transcriptional regulator [Tyzzerella sp.]|nr:LacI family DNA-binding transcriptional regulator [Tyzzerella sp.]
MARVTIYDIAKVANVSTATVSLSLSGNERIRPETRKRIKEIADQLGYSPNYIAQSLSTRATHTLGLIIPNIDNPVYSQMVAGVELYANQKGYNLILGLSNSNLKKELFYFDMLQRERVDGLILFPTFMDALEDKLNKNEEMKSKVVLCGSSGISSIKDISYAKCNNRIGAFLAVSHLIETGRKRIGCIFPVSTEQQYYSRKLGYQEALRSHNIPYDESLIKVCSSNDESIVCATKELLDEQHPDAIFCLYDYCAFNVMHAIQSKGLHIPHDISVIGYDNIPMGNYYSTTLSTIDTHGAEVGRLAAELLVEKLTIPDTPVRQITVEPELVVRDSTTL